MGKPPHELFGIPAKDIAELFQVDLSTARRWKRGAICPPRAVLIVLSGELGFLSPYWRGWRIRGADIIAPGGWTISRQDALIVPLMHGQIAALRADLARARERIEELERIENQPLPDSWEIGNG